MDWWWLRRQGESHARGSSGRAGCDPARFVRIHRSTIVNLERIGELQPYFHGEYAVILRDGTRLKLSRGYHERLEAALRGD